MIWWYQVVRQQSVESYMNNSKIYISFKIYMVTRFAAIWDYGSCREWIFYDWTTYMCLTFCYIITRIWIPITKIRRSHDRLIFIMEKLYLERPSLKKKPYPGLILALRPANKRRRYKVTPSLIGWAQTYDQPCILTIVRGRCWHILCLMETIYRSLLNKPVGATFATITLTGGQNEIC